MKKTLLLLLSCLILATSAACTGGEASSTVSTPTTESTGSVLSEGASSDAESASDESNQTGADTSKEESSENNESSAAASTEESSENNESSAAVSTEESNENHESSLAASKEETSAEASVNPDTSEEISEDPNRTAQPEVYGCTRIETKCFVLLGTCAEGAVITATAGDQKVTSASDHGYFSIRLEGTAPTEVTLVAETDEKTASLPLTFTARPRSVSSNQWGLIAGADYQFHLQYTLNDYLHNNLYTQSTLDSFTRKLEKRLDNLTEISPNTEIVYVLVPSPATIYPEGMPDSYVPDGDISRLDQVTQAIQDAGATVIDLRDTFAEHKNDEYKLYWKTDSHWTDYGAFIAYTELFNHIAEKFPAAAPRAFDEFDWQEGYYLGGDISHYLEYYNIGKVVNGVYPDEALMQEYNVLRVPKFTEPSVISSVKRYVGDKILTYNTKTVQNAYTLKTEREELPTALVLRDSYSTQMFDILAERMDTTWYNAMWDDTYNASRIKQLQPDYLIYIIVERNLDGVISS